MVKAFLFKDLEAEEHVEEPPEPTFSAEDMTKAVEEACRQTAQDVETKTRASLMDDLSHRQVLALEAIRDHLGTSLQAYERSMTDTVRMAEDLAKAIGRAVVPKALALQPFADIEAMIRQSLDRLVGQPSLELKLEASLVEPVGNLLHALADEMGFKGSLTTVPDPALTFGDARLIWKNGSIDRDLEKIREEADLLVEAWLQDRSAEGPSRQNTDIADTASAECFSSENGAPS